MPWNWQLPSWPEFYFKSEKVLENERAFLLAVGAASTYLQKMGALFKTGELRYTRYWIKL